MCEAEKDITVVWRVRRVVWLYVPVFGTVGTLKKEAECSSETSMRTYKYTMVSHTIRQQCS